MLGARPQASEPSVNSTIPATKSLRRLQRSPKRPSVTRRTANTRMQAFITHSMLPKLVSKYPWMCGMAMFTIVPSSRIMKRPRQRTASTAHGFRAGLAGGASAAFEFTSGGGRGSSCVGPSFQLVDERLEKGDQRVRIDVGKAREDGVELPAPALVHIAGVALGAAGETHVHDASVVGVRLAVDDVLLEQAGDQLASGGARDLEAVGELAHRDIRRCERNTTASIWRPVSGSEVAARRASAWCGADSERATANSGRSWASCVVVSAGAGGAAPPAPASPVCPFVVTAATSILQYPNRKGTLSACGTSGPSRARAAPSFHRHACASTLRWTRASDHRGDAQWISPSTGGRWPPNPAPRSSRRPPAARRW